MQKLWIWKAGHENKLPLPLNLDAHGHDLYLRDNDGTFDRLVEDMGDSADMAGVYGQILHWHGDKGDMTGRFGFPVMTMTPQGAVGNTYMLATTILSGGMDVKVLDRLPHMRLSMPVCAADYVKSVRRDEVEAIKGLLADNHPEEVSGDIRDRASWLESSDVRMAVGTFAFAGREIQGVRFDYPDRSQMAITAQEVVVPMVTYAKGDRSRVMWGEFGRA